MIARGETVDSKRELVFRLAVGNLAVTGHVFTSGEVQVCLPGGTSHSNADTTRIVERGNGDYALRFTDAQVANSGTISVYVAAGNADPVYYIVTIGPGILAGETTDSKREVVFQLTLGTSPVTGHAWQTGELALCLPGGSGGAAYTNVDTTRIVERGHSFYAHPLTNAQASAAGTGSLYIAASGADVQSVPFEITAAADLQGIGFPTYSNTTTVEAIRDRFIAVIEGITPTHLTGDKFRRYRNEGKGDFIEFCETTPAQAQRRFQVRGGDKDQPAEVSNVDVEERTCTLTAIIAYKQDARAGANNALDRDDIIDEDWRKIDYRVGVCGRANFSPTTDSSYPDATPLGCTKTIQQGNACDFLIVTAEFRYRRVNS